MPARMFLLIASVTSLLTSASVSAHVVESGAVLPHFLTGEHLLILIIVGICIAGVSKFYRRFR